MRSRRREATEKRISKIKRNPDVAIQIKMAEEDRAKLAAGEVSEYMFKYYEKWVRRGETAAQRFLNGHYGYTGDVEYWLEGYNARRRVADLDFRERLRDFEEEPDRLDWLEDFIWNEQNDDAEPGSSNTGPYVIDRLFGFPIPPIVVER